MVITNDETANDQCVMGAIAQSEPSLVCALHVVCTLSSVAV